MIDKKKNITGNKITFSYGGVDMSIFPIIRKGKQKMYEDIFVNDEVLFNNIPEICGYYGRACRQMDDKADRMLCNGCSLSIFISTVNTIIEVSDEKQKIGIDSLYDSDVYDIQDKLKEKCINVEFSYIETILERLTMK